MLCIQESGEIVAGGKEQRWQFRGRSTERLLDANNMVQWSRTQLSVLLPQMRHSTPAEAHRVAEMAHDGMARAIRPCAYDVRWRYAFFPRHGNDTQAAM